MSSAFTRPRRVLVATTVALGTLAVPAAAQAAPDTSPFTFAVIGDIPYGSAEITAFPANIAQINADPSVQFVTHLGDIKNGSSECSDEYFANVRADFDHFQDPLVYSVGDNEWTDCHRANNGGYNPLERLAAVRDVFFDRPGHTPGQNGVGVQSQADRGVPENVSYTRAGVRFVAMDVVGSNNGLAPWTGHSTTTPEQVAEEQARMAATIDLVDQTFDRAQHGQAVVLMLQADMFDPTVGNPQFSDYSAFQPLVQTIASRAAAHDGPVYLVNGDSHVYNEDHPLASGSDWLSFYGVTTPASNLTRITVDGSDNAHDYLRVRVNQNQHGDQTLTWERVPFTTG
ncbi:hypothetical protein [Geodermatophilus ruber]|uniref:Calcineurin-like phosphoesterase n=1 Tax=Geodermatophilus ruber TaxID=504800 RepID=A0A1I4AQ30_9ACTN|nr:hypothetical protein [Geodermatophilus ruber]SFK58595.1 hypothetical protein SAMN04488085_102344 [Geodermatophilus ruber]